MCSKCQGSHTARWNRPARSRMASAAGSPLDGAASPSADGWGAVAADSDEDLGAGDDAGDLLSDEELEDAPALARRDLGPPDSSSSDDDGDDAPPEIDLDEAAASRLSQFSFTQEQKPPPPNPRLFLAHGGFKVAPWWFLPLPLPLPLPPPPLPPAPPDDDALGLFLDLPARPISSLLLSLLYYQIYSVIIRVNVYT